MTTADRWVARHTRSGGHLSERGPPFPRRLYPTATDESGTPGARCSRCTDGEREQPAIEVASRDHLPLTRVGSTRRNFTRDDRAELMDRLAPDEPGSQRDRPPALSPSGERRR